MCGYGLPGTSAELADPKDTPPAKGGGAKASPFGSPLPEPPPLPESASLAAVSIAIVGLNPNAKAPAPAPDGSRDAQFSAGPQPRPAGGTDASVEGAILTAVSYTHLLNPRRSARVVRAGKQPRP